MILNLSQLYQDHMYQDHLHYQQPQLSAYSLFSLYLHYDLELVNPFSSLVETQFFLHQLQMLEFLLKKIVTLYSKPYIHEVMLVLHHALSSLHSMYTQIKPLQGENVSPKKNSLSITLSFVSSKKHQLYSSNYKSTSKKKWLSSILQVHLIPSFKQMEKRVK